MPEAAGSAGSAGFSWGLGPPLIPRLRLSSSGYDARVEHRFRGPPYTIGIEEELMIVDRETLDLSSSIEGLLEGVDGIETDGEVKPELMESVCEIATRAVPQHARGGRPAALAAPARAAGGAPARARHRLRRHASVRALGGPAHRVAPALPRADRRPPVRGPPGDHLRHPRARRDRRPRQGHPRLQRHARAPADPARPVRQLAVLARPADRPPVHPHADLPRLPARRDPAALRGLRGLEPAHRVHDHVEGRSPTTPTSGTTCARTRTSGPSRSA